MPTPPTAYDETAKGPGLSGLLEILRRRRMLAVLPFLFVLTAAVSLAGAIGQANDSSGWKGRPARPR